MSMNLLSSPNTPAITSDVGASLGSYVRDQRALRGLTLTELGEVAHVSKSHLSQIETGKIALPSPEIRRRLARALGISHVALLLAAGELNEEDVRASGLDAVPLLEPERARLLEKLEGLRLNEDRVVALDAIMDRWERFDRDAERPVHDLVVGDGDGG